MYYFATSFRGRFTLVELLTVIAVIAVLCAMLLPALNSAKLKGMAIQCTNNQKQLGYAHLNYAMENAEHMICTLGKNGSGSQWGKDLTELGYLISQKYEISLTKGLRCPVLPVGTTNAYNHSYGMFYTDNIYFFKAMWAHVYQIPGVDASFGFQQKKMRRPSTIGVMGDSFYIAENTQWTQIRYQKATVPFILPHFKRGNLLMADGHVAVWSKSGLAQIYTHVEGSEFSNVVGIEY